MIETVRRFISEELKPLEDEVEEKGYLDSTHASAIYKKSKAETGTYKGKSESTHAYSRALEYVTVCSGIPSFVHSVERVRERARARACVRCHQTKSLTNLPSMWVCIEGWYVRVFVCPHVHGFESHVDLAAAAPAPLTLPAATSFSAGASKSG
jgi:hypothetical protein